MDGIGLRITLCLTFVIAGIAIAWTSRAAARGRLGRNPYAGIRTRTTMHSDETWSAAHRASRPWTDVGGGLSVLVGAGTLFPLPEQALTALVGVGAVGLLGFTLGGAWVGIRAVRKLPSDDPGPVDSNAGSK